MEKKINILILCVMTIACSKKGVHSMNTLIHIRESLSLSLCISHGGRRDEKLHLLDVNIFNLRIDFVFRMAISLFATAI